MSKYLLFPILIGLVITAQTASAFDIDGKVTRVIDGDTIIVKPKIGKKIEVRLDMVNTPEIGDKGAKEARAFAKNLCLNKSVRVNVDDGNIIDHYGRIIGQVYCQGSLLDKLLIDNKLAEFTYTSFCPTSEFQYEDWILPYCHPMG